MNIVFNVTKLKEIKQGHLNVSEIESDIDITNLYFKKGGKPFYIISGEFQFSRYDNALWEQEILKMKAGGINTIATYTFWNHHERKKGEWTFNGDCDLNRFISLCSKNHMFVILRMGPYSHGEAKNGGFPDWIWKRKDKRTNSEWYLKEVETMYAKYYEQVKEFLYQDNAGTIIGIQLENEYTKDESHIKMLKKIACKIGFKVPIYTVTAWSGGIPGDYSTVPLFGTYPEAPWSHGIKPLPNENRFKINKLFIDKIVGNDNDTLRKNSNDILTYRIMQETPLSMCELGAGVQVTTHRRPYISTMDAYVLSLLNIAKGVNLLGYYVFHGGRNPNFAPMQERSCGFENCLPILNYDFQAPLGEYGIPKEKFYYLKLLHYFVSTFDVCDKQSVFMNKNDFNKYNNLFTSNIRVNECAEGFCFVNTYEKGCCNSGIKNLNISVRQNDEILEFPVLNLHSGISFFFPFNLKIGDVNFPYIMAQPVLKIEKDESIRYIFAKLNGICPEYSCNKQKVFSEKGELKTGFENALKFNWADKNYSIELYDFSDCLKMFYDTDTKRVDFALSDKNILYYNNGEKIEIFREQINEKYCEIKKSHRKKMQYDKYFYKKFCKKLNYTLKINKEIFNKYRDAVLIIDAPCDMAHMYCSGNIVADYININNTWQIGLSRFKDDILNDATFEIRTCAIKRYQKTYFNSEIHMNDASIKLNRIYGYK